MIAILVPDIELEHRVDLIHEFFLALRILVHVQVLHKIVNRDLGCLYRSQVQNSQVIKHGLISFLLVSDLAVDIIAFAEHNREEIVSYLTLPYFLQLLLFDLTEEVG